MRLPEIPLDVDAVEKFFSAEDEGAGRFRAKGVRQLLTSELALSAPVQCY
jgi:hypothetical protein